MQQGVTKAQPKGQLAEVSQKPVACERLTIASVPHEMWSQQGFLIGGSEVKQCFGAPLKFAKARRMGIA